MTRRLRPRGKPSEDRYPPFDDAAADLFTLRRNEATCFDFAAHTYCDATASTEDKRFPCRSFWVASCGPFFLARAVAEEAVAWAAYEGIVWRAVYPADEQTRKNLNKAVSRAPRGSRVGVSMHVRGTRSGETITETERWVYATRPLPVVGALRDWEPVGDVVSALEDLRAVGLALPGVVRAPRLSGAWSTPAFIGPLPEDAWGTAEYRRWLANLPADERGDERREQIAFHAAHLAMQAGHQLVTAYDGRPPLDCDPDRWGDLLEQAAAALRGPWPVGALSCAVGLPVAMSPFGPRGDLAPLGPNGDRDGLSNTPASQQLSLVNMPTTGHTEGIPEALPAAEELTSTRQEVSR